MRNALHDTTNAWPENKKARSNVFRPMSALGHKRKSKHVRVMSALPPKADIDRRLSHVREVPIADISISYAIRSCMAFL
jgi:hypothetical protein